jgi:hypothetical protein
LWVLFEKERIEVLKMHQLLMWGGMMNCDILFHGRVRVEIDVTVEERTKQRGENKSVSNLSEAEWGKPRRRPKGHVVGPAEGQQSKHQAHWMWSSAEPRDNDL